MIYLKASNSDTFYTALKSLGWMWDDVYRTQTIPAVTRTITHEDGSEEDIIVENEKILVLEDIVTEGGINLEDDTHKLELIGSIWQFGEESIDESGGRIVDRRGSDEFHANLLMKDGSNCPEVLQPFVIDTPATPYKTFEVE